MSILLMAATMMGTAAWPVDHEVAFDCVLENDVITHRANGEWQVTGGGAPRNSFHYKDTRLTLRTDGKVSIDLPGQALHLSGEYGATATSDGIISWAASAPGYCGVLDAQCLATGAFYSDNPSQGVLSIYVPNFANKDGRRSFASIQFLYTCKRAS
jgi:hypothetical protein